jgi:hypothetical protein
MSAQQVIEEFKALPPAERAQVSKFVVENDDSWIPESFKQGMVEATTGYFNGKEKELAAMAKDPQIQRELRSINTEFAAAESDGLGKI